MSKRFFQVRGRQRAVAGVAQARLGARFSHRHPQIISETEEKPMHNNLIRRNPVSLVLWLTILLSLAGTQFAEPPVTSAQNAAPRRRALLVGIDRYQHPKVSPTPGAEEDARATRRQLIETYGFAEADIRMLLGSEATAQRIRETFQRWLIDGTKAGDEVFFLYSGHGTTVKDVDGDEARRSPGDVRDEALAPYDVGVSRNSRIIDDEIGGLLNQLSGRRVIMVFDSCFSGTVTRGSKDPAAGQQTAIPRYLPDADELEKLTTRSGGKGAGDDYVVLPSSSSVGAAKDLRLVEEGVEIKTGALIIFSAAQAHQLAYSIPVRPNYFRGALTFLLNQALEDPRLPLRDLQATLTRRMESLRRDKLKASQRQDPYFEVFSASPLVNQPLFGAPPAASVAPPVTTPATHSAAAATTGRLSLRTLDNRDTYYFGTENGRDYHDEVAYEVEMDKEGYLYLLVFSVGNVATRLFPNPDQPNNRLSAGRHKIFDDPSQDKGFLVGEPEGKDIVVALRSPKPLNFERDNYTWNEVFAILNSPRFRERVEGLKQGQTSRGQRTSSSFDTTDWQSVSLIIEAKRLNK